MSMYLFWYILRETKIKLIIKKIIEIKRRRGSRLEVTQPEKKPNLYLFRLKNNQYANSVNNGPQNGTKCSSSDCFLFSFCM